MTGLVVGLRVGLPATPHWVASSLNLWRVGMCVLLLCALAANVNFGMGFVLLLLLL